MYVYGDERYNRNIDVRMIGTGNEIGAFDITTHEGFKFINTVNFHDGLLMFHYFVREN